MSKKLLLKKHMVVRLKNFKMGEWPDYWVGHMHNLRGAQVTVKNIDETIVTLLEEEFLWSIDDFEKVNTNVI